MGDGSASDNVQNDDHSETLEVTKRIAVKLRRAEERFIP